MNCGTVASGIVAACKENPLKVPMIVRLQGTNSQAAKKIMEESGLPVKMITDADEAAKAAVEASKGKWKRIYYCWIVKFVSSFGANWPRQYVN